MFKMAGSKNLFITLAVVICLFCLEAVNCYHPDYYGKPCSKDYYPEGNLVQCDRDRNMHCSDKGVCECLVGERGRIFAHYQKTCIEIASPENNFACTEDIQCKLSLHGKFSRCNRDFDHCECYDETEKTVLVGNVCFRQLPARSFQKPGLQGCSNDVDCQQSSLGKNSRCNKAATSCECYDWSNWDREVSFYNGTCVYKKDLRQLCIDDSECRAGFHKNAVCANHPSYLPKEKICQCPEGVNCDGSAYSTFNAQSRSILMIGLTTAIMGILATKVLS